MPFSSGRGKRSIPIALIVKHLAGNLQSRWTDFLTTDGDKPTRDRDGEFTLTPADTRTTLLAAWERGWATLFATLSDLTDADLAKTIAIRGEPHTVQQALAARPEPHGLPRRADCLRGPVAEAGRTVHHDPARYRARTTSPPT